MIFFSSSRRNEKVLKQIIYKNKYLIILTFLKEFHDYSSTFVKCCQIFHGFYLIILYVLSIQCLFKNAILVIIELNWIEKIPYHFILNDFLSLSFFIFFFLNPQQSKPFTKLFIKIENHIHYLYQDYLYSRISQTSSAQKFLFDL